MVTLRDRAHVRVPRPPGHDRAAARARLPRHLARAPSTAAATTTWASRNRSSSRRSSTTRSTRSGDEHLHHHDREDRRRSARRFSPRSSSRSGLRGLVMAKLAVINREAKRRSDRQEVRREARSSFCRSSTIRRRPTKPATKRAPSCRRCRATPPRCACATAARMTGRPRGTFRKFGLARNKIREIAMRGEIPGMIKASW